MTDAAAIPLKDIDAEPLEREVWSVEAREQFEQRIDIWPEAKRLTRRMLVTTFQKSRKAHIHIRESSEGQRADVLDIHFEAYMGAICDLVGPAIEALEKLTQPTSKRKACRFILNQITEGLISPATEYLVPMWIVWAWDGVTVEDARAMQDQYEYFRHPADPQDPPKIVVPDRIPASLDLKRIAVNEKLRYALVGPLRLLRKTMAAQTLQSTQATHAHHVFFPTTSDYREVSCDGFKVKLRSDKASAIKFMHEKFKNGDPRCSTGEINRAARRSIDAKVSHLFRTKDKLRVLGIFLPSGDGFYELAPHRYTHE